MPAGSFRFPLFSQTSFAAQVAILLALSAFLITVFEFIQLPAAVLLGAVIASMFLAAGEGTLRMPSWGLVCAQGIIGCLIARSVSGPILVEMVRDWPIFILGVGSVIVASVVLGLILTRQQILPGTTAIWGSFPGAAAAMVLMSASFGADMRLVAFMHYLRVVMVVLAAAVVTRIFVTIPEGATAATVWFPPIDTVAFIQTLAIAILGIVVTLFFKLPAGGLIFSFAVGAVLQTVGLVSIELPPWLLAISYVVLGWSIGLRFTREIFMHAMRALPRVMASILALMALCGAMAAVLSLYAGIDPLTAYLATSPGGADSVVVIAASGNVDAPFVMAMQTTRFLVVLIIGPWLSRLVAHYSGVSRSGQ